MPFSSQTMLGKAKRLSHFESTHPS